MLLQNHWRENILRVMSYPVTIGGESVNLAWTQDIARRYPFRASKIGGAPSARAMTNPKTAVAAVTAFLWLILPPETHALYPTPEDLFLAIDHESDHLELHAALAGVISDMAPDAEKKSTSGKSPSPESNAD